MHSMNKVIQMLWALKYLRLPILQKILIVGLELLGIHCSQGKQKERTPPKVEFLFIY